MVNLKSALATATLIVSAGLLFSGCGYALKYRLNDRDIVKAESKAALNIQVATFNDGRDPAEKQKSARQDQDFDDVGDYTYDREFKGDVAKEISRMLVAHLEYAEFFSKVELSSYHSSEISSQTLTQLRAQDVDAVLVGEIDHFYGYYDRKPAKEFLYAFGVGIGFGLPVAFATTTTKTTDFGAARVQEVRINPTAISLATGLGANVGRYLESTGKRTTEKRTRLSVKLLNATDQKVLWEDTIDVHSQEHKAMPGVNTTQRKFHLAVSSLREAVNQLVKRISEASIPTQTD